jgi:RNA polymerase sigma-70 factor (ECF subfamily)
MRRAGWITGTGLVAAGVATALVLVNVVGLAGWRGGADAAAASTLDAAAAAAIKNSDPIVGPGQFLEVSTHAAYANFTQTPDGSPTAFLASQDGQVYIPANPAGQWTWIRDPQKPVQTFGAESEKAAAVAPVASAPERLHGVGGGFYGSPAHITPASLAALPKDPTQLLEFVYRATRGRGVSRDGEALVWIADTLRSGIAPAEVRATLYRTAALIPGVTLTPGAANLDGRTGVAIGRDETNGTRQEIIINPSNGLVIGERQVLLRASSGLPAGASMGWTAVTTTVVDSVPSEAGK